MINNHQFENLPEFLSECVRLIKKRHPRFTSIQLSKRLGLSNSTFDRISKSDVKFPSFNNALKIVREACGEKNLLNFIKKFYPEMLEEFVSIYPNNNAVKFVEAGAEKFFEDSSSYELMLMISSGKGVTRNLVQEEMGKKGLKVLDTLIKNTIVEEKNGRIQINGKINATQTTVHQLMQNLIASNYHIENFGKEGNWLTVQYEAVNKDLAWPVIKSALNEANKKIKEVFANPIYQGKDIVWVGLSGDSLISDQKKMAIERQGELQ